MVDLVLRNNGTEQEIVEATRYAFRRMWELKRSGSMPRTHYLTWRAAHPMPQRPAAAAQQAQPAAASA